MNRLTRKETQQITRERLRDAGRRVIAQHGVGGAGIEEIVRDAGFTRGAFYANYRSKLDLLADMLAATQVREIRLLNEMFLAVDELETGLRLLVERSVSKARIYERTLVSLELQLQAERDPVFREQFTAHLDTIYAEVRRLLTTILRRHGKGVPPDIDATVVLAYQFGLHLGSASILGNALARTTTPAQILNQLLTRMIEAAPALPAAE